ncbi:MAG: integrase [Thermoprotei archaeon]|nr:MAG: integrase [Thermoprotei archaeon]
MARLYAWDRGLDYERARRELLKIVRDREAKGVRGLTRRAYAAVLLIQLTNGLRVAEACEAALKWASTGGREVKVRVLKRKDVYERLVVIPKELGGEERRLVAALSGEDPKRLAAKVKVFCKRALGYNTHALRYAFITHLARRGYPAQLIAKLTGHRKLDYILHYTEKAAAEDVLRALLT